MMTFKVLLAIFIVATIQYSALGREGRGILEFGIIVTAITKSNALRYNGYGCFCGFGGKGQPVDGVDRCCKVHDLCYGRLQRNTCTAPLAVYLTPYLLPVGGCNKFGTACGKDLCRCDLSAALCFKRHTFHQQYRNYNKGSC